MADERRLPEPTELIYLPEPSWAPIFAAAGLAALAADIFTTWVYSVVGAVVFLVAMKAWIGEIDARLARLPRRQRLTTAKIPAEPLRRRSDASESLV